MTIPHDPPSPVEQQPHAADGAAAAPAPIEAGTHVAFAPEPPAEQPTGIPAPHETDEGSQPPQPFTGAPADPSRPIVAASDPGEPPAAPGERPEAPVGPSGGEPPPPRRTRVQRFRSWRFAPIVEVLVTIALALVLAEGVQAAVVKPFVIPSPSMEPTLIPSQRVLVNRLAYDFGSPQRGDIVVFHPPSSQSCAVFVPTDEPCPRSVSTPASDYYVKRVIGLPGDRIAIRDGHPVINGHLLSHEPYIAPCGGAPECNMPHAIVVPKGDYFMMGDNRGDSDDSRFWGPVPSSWIIGKVFATYWPPDRIGIF